MKTKICTKCHKRKLICEFSKHKAYNGGYRHQCKNCVTIYQKEYNKKWQKNNKEKILQYRKENKENFRRWHRVNYEKNKLKYQKNHTIISKLRYNNDINYRFLINTRNRINKALRGKDKSLNIMMLIGCEIDYLMFHIQEQFTKGMSWDNYGLWHIDHKIPCASFDLSKSSEQHKCFHYTNLQPLWAIDNLRKSDQY